MTVTGVVAFSGDSKGLEEPLPGRAASPAALPLTGAGRATGATTKGPHIHERWGESRKLELSYCITGLIGDDAELEADYHTLIRSFVDTTAEWERVTGANFVHVVTQLAAEDPIMTVSKEDYEAEYWARERAIGEVFYQMDLLAAYEEGEAKGAAKVLLEHLGLRFGPPPPATRARIETATIEQLYTWIERVVTAQTIDEVVAP